MYIDSHPRHEEKFPETVKAVISQSRLDPIIKYKSAFAILHMETSVDSIHQNAKKYTVIQKARDSVLPLDITFADDELILFNLKEDLISRMIEYKENPSFDILLFELIVLSSHLVRYQLISSVLTIPDSCKVIINPVDFRFDYTKLDITKLLESLLLILFTGDDLKGSIKLSTSEFEKQKKNKKNESELTENENIIFQEENTSAMIEVMKATTSYIKSVLEIEEIDTGYKNKCKIEICKLLVYVLN